MKDGRKTLERLATIGEYSIHLRGWLSAISPQQRGIDKAEEAVSKIEKEIRALHKELGKFYETHSHESSITDFLKTDNTETQEN